MPAARLTKSPADRQHRSRRGVEDVGIARGGEIEVLVSELFIFNEAKTPPFPIEDDIATSEDLRLKFRYLDLRRTPMAHNLKLRHQITMATRRFMDSQGFYEIETPFLTKSTPEGRGLKRTSLITISRLSPGTGKEKLR